MFDAESSNPVEFQQAGWQAIMDNISKPVPNKTNHREEDAGEGARRLPLLIQV
ncbi:SRPBCC family protein [Paenibacillus riograndensis]|uniref:hypothetical protein n=1 Tax=Paenibacillus riograndensis TaxID=483937 RepID=UPI0018D42C97